MSPASADFPLLNLAVIDNIQAYEGAAGDVDEGIKGLKLTMLHLFDYDRPPVLRVSQAIRVDTLNLGHEGLDC